MDASCSGGANLTLAVGAVFSCVATKTFLSVATYTWFADYQSSDLVYHQLSNVGSIGIVAATPPPRPTTLTANQALTSNQSLWSSDGRFEAIMQGDGNLVVYGPSGAIYSSNTASASSAGSQLIMQSDGNLVIYNPSGAAIWSSSTAPSDGDYLIMQSDGNLVVYSGGGSPLWNSFAHPISSAPGSGSGSSGGGSSTGNTFGYPYQSATGCGSGIWCINGKWISPFGFGYRNCTDFVAYKLGINWGQMAFPNGDGNAEGWFNSPHFSHSRTATVGSVAYWDSTLKGSGGLGHVAYVVSVNADGSANVEQYNKAVDGNGSTGTVTAMWYLVLK